MSVNELLPLSVDGSGGYVSPGAFFLTSADGIEIVASCWDRAIAEEIVRACNSHEDLLALARDVAAYMKATNQSFIGDLSSGTGFYYVTAERALALAESK